MSRKLDWERVQIENHIAKSGATTLKPSGKPAKAKPKCSFCKETLKSDGPITFAKHKLTCSSLLKEKEKKRKVNRSWRISKAKPFVFYIEDESFPACLIGKLRRTSSFIGRGKELSNGGNLIRLESREGIEKPLISNLN